MVRLKPSKEPIEISLEVKLFRSIVLTAPISNFKVLYQSIKNSTDLDFYSRQTDCLVKQQSSSSH
jgi:hypothetical protein